MRRLPVVEHVVAEYFAEVGGREVIALLAREAVPRWRELRVGQYWLASRAPLEVAIGLSTGGYAVLETRGDISRRIWGMPPGFLIGALGALVGLAAIVAIMREARPLRRLAGSVAGFAESAVPHPVEATRCARDPPPHRHRQRHAGAHRRPRQGTHGAAWAPSPTT